MLSNSEIKYDSEFMVRALRAVADPARLRLLRLCSDQPTSVSELAAATADSEPNVSRQLKQLALAGLLRRVRRGQRVEYLPVSCCSDSIQMIRRYARLARGCGLSRSPRVIPLCYAQQLTSGCRQGASGALCVSPSKGS